MWVIGMLVELQLATGNRCDRGTAAATQKRNAGAALDKVPDCEDRNVQPLRKFSQWSDGLANRLVAEDVAIEKIVNCIDNDKTGIYPDNRLLNILLGRLWDEAAQNGSNASRGNSTAHGTSVSRP